MDIVSLSVTSYIYHIFKSRSLRNYFCSWTLSLHTVVSERCAEDGRVSATSSQTAVLSAAYKVGCPAC